MRRIVGIVIVLVVIILGVIGVVMASGSPATAANNFLTAFAHGDAKGCAKSAYLEGMDEAKSEAAWAKTLESAKYYRFLWKVKSSTTTNDQEATVDLEFVKNADNGSAYPENYSLPMIKKNGEWKVDARQITRSMLPMLPR